MADLPSTPPPGPWRNWSYGGALLLIAAFSFRLALGLASEFWSEDETQIYLLGLRYYSTGAWPYFGPDVVWTGTQIPGALQGLLVGLPLRLLPLPEAPFILLNLISLAGLGLLAVFVRWRLPELPGWFVWGSLLTLPWTLNFSTHIVNPSYVLAGSVVFFVGAFEALPSLRREFLPRPAAHFMMGFGLLWVAQLHLSWVLLLPFILYALTARAREGARALLMAALGTAAGAALPGSLLLPTLVGHGLLWGAGGIGQNVRLRFLSPGALLTIAAQFLSFASFEVNRFLGLSAARRLILLAQNPWLFPLTLVVGLVGVVQPLVLVWLGFRGRSSHPEWTSLRNLTAATPLLVYFSYFLAVKEPWAHAFYVVCPVALVYAFYCWSFLLAHRSWRRAAAALLLTGVLFQAALVLARAPERSLYKNRRVVAEAIRHRNPEMLGHRRPFARDADPGAREAVVRVPVDLHVIGSSWSRAVGGVALWTVTIRNEGAVAYRDLWFTTAYRGASGEPRGAGEGVLAEVIQPGELRTIAGVNDGFVAPEAQSGEMAIARAQRLVPLEPVPGGE
jgi:hypothetical protein